MKKDNWQRIKNSQKVAILVIMLLSLFFVGGCRENFFIFNEKPKIDPRIYKELEKNEWVPVLVRLKDNSGITIEGTKDQRVALSIKKDEWFKPVIDEVASTLSEDEFELTYKHTSEFRGKITKKGFEKLVQNQNVGEIILESGPFPHITEET